MLHTSETSPTSTGGAHAHMENRPHAARLGCCSRFIVVPGSSFIKAVFFMHTNRPVTRMFSAALGKLSGLRVFLMLLLGAGIVCATALAAQAPAAKSSDAPSTGAAHADFVG